MKFLPKLNVFMKAGKKAKLELCKELKEKNNFRK